METLNLEFESERDLYQSYMPFLKQGGIFVKTAEQFDLGSEVLLDILLPDALESSEVRGSICWLTPIGAQNGTPAGVGISFTEDPDNVRNQIEKAIGRLLNCSDPTLSM
ncbi:MAG: PilZ domain-containing protein [Alteromonadaceae bacterium]|nr:PilZ domain-containing protein [Alteromonadaceae bacterium]